MQYNLNDTTERTRYYAQVDTDFRKLKHDTDPRALRRNIINVLERLARHSSNPTGLTRANLRHLARLVALVQPEDLQVTGGLLGGSNAWYAAQLGLEPATITTIFRALKRAGMISPHNPTANHRRACQRTQSGTKDGRGYSLKPLVVKLPLLQDWARELDREALTRQAKRGELTNLLRQNAAKLIHLPESDLHQRHAAIVAAANELASQCDLSELTQRLHEAFSLSCEVDTALVQDDPCRDYQTVQTGKKSRQHHTDEKPVSTLVEAIQEGSSRSGSSSNEPVDGIRREGRSKEIIPETDSAMSSGATLAEASVLFAEDKHLLPETASHEDVVVATSILGEKSAINPRLLGRALETMGVAQTFWAVLLVRARQRRGEIRTSPGAYFNALVSRARTGALDLDRSIWGERERLTVKGTTMRKH